MDLLPKPKPQKNINKDTKLKEKNCKQFDLDNCRRSAFMERKRRKKIYILYLKKNNKINL